MIRPTSENHCQPCAFSDVEPAGAGRALRAEVDMVWVVDPENTAYSSKRIQEAALGDGVDPRRLLAARSCAAAILNGDCPLHIFINRGRGNKFNIEARAEAV
jgi:hypothetical protein